MRASGLAHGLAWALAGVALVAAASLAALLLFTPVPLWLVLQGGRPSIDDHRHFAAAPVARSVSPVPLPRQPQALRWPHGLTTAQAEADLAAHDTVALLVARQGRLVYERYFDGFTAEQPAAVFSLAKSVLSLLLGVAIDEGRIGSLDDPLLRYLPELRAQAPGFSGLTLRHLLLMRSGIDFDEGYRSPTSDVARLYLTPDILAEVARLRMRRAPDGIHAYQSGDTQLLALALERATGTALPAYLQGRLWQALGTEFDASWSLDDRQPGQVRAFCCLNARARDLLRLGLLVAADGRWQGRELVSARWLAESLRPASGLPGPADPAWRNIERPYSPEAAFYAGHWRIRPEPGGPPLRPGRMVYAQGLHGQILLVDRESGTVVLRLGRRQGGRHWPGWIDELVRLNR